MNTKSACDPLHISPFFITVDTSKRNAFVTTKHRFVFIRGIILSPLKQVFNYK